jgi:hypothetical protein
VVGVNEEARNTCNIGNTTLREDIQNKNKAQKTRRLTPTTTKTGNKTKAKKKTPIKKNTYRFFYFIVVHSRNRFSIYAL